ncbi:TPA: hypothetical protein ACI7II_005149, partial [Escherichia coli]
SCYIRTATDSHTAGKPVLTESTYKGLSGVRGNSHAPFLGGGGAAMCRCYPTRQTEQHCSSQNQSSR